ncbi:MAG: DEAD/DEAH box helicase [Rhabdochlamydiaceae bacterium]
MRIRRGKYEEAISGILEHLVTNTSDGRAPRPTLEEKFGLKESSASDVFKTMRERGLIDIKKLTVKKMDTIKITDKGRAEYQSRYQRGEYRLPINVKKYIEHQGISEDRLFPIQQDFVNRGLIFRRKNVCVFGYPGAGKTLVAEMTMVHELTEGGKALYCTPYKALDWQKYNDFSESFKIFPNSKISIADGDNRISANQLLESDIIIATYEWVLGAIREKDPWLDKITLVCADELTLLGDEERGGSIDTVLTSLKNMSQKPRIVTISSLVGNALPISGWLEAEPLIENRPAFQMPIEENMVYREKDKMIIMSKEGNRSEITTDKSPFEFIVENNLKQDKTTIVFTGIKPSAEKIAKDLLKLHEPNPVLKKMSDEFLSNMSHRTTQAEDVCRLVSSGIAYHHAGLQKPLRKFIEKLLHQNLLRTVVATTTLSHGVNYRIDSAIIELGWFDLVKGSLPVYEYLNLKGRTGRPGKSRSASIYLIAWSLSGLKPDEIFTKYFLSTPEPIWPISTFNKDRMELMLLSHSKPELDLEGTISSMKGTLQYINEPNTKFQSAKIIESLLDTKLLQKDGKKISATTLGENIIRSNLSPSDAIKISSIPRDSGVDDLLSLAVEIDIAKRIRFVSKLQISKNEILKKWMRGESLDEIRKDVGHFYDQELIDLVSYTSVSLKKMSVLVEDKKLNRKISTIRKKLISK